MGKRTERKERDRSLRRADILRAAERVFALNGYHQATISAIARQAGYAVGTVYLYFQDKKNLYLSLMEDKFDYLQASIEKETEGEKDSLKKIRAMVKAHLKFFDDNINFFKIHFSDPKTYAMNRRILKKHMDYMEFLAVIMKQAVEGGKLKKMPPDKLAISLLAIIKSVVFQTIVADKTPESFLGYQDFVLELFLRGAKR